MPSRLFPTIRSDFARLIAQKFAPGRLLLVGGEGDQLADQSRSHGIESTTCRGITELDALPQNGSESHFDAAIWFYSPDGGLADDSEVLDRLTSLTTNLVLIPTPRVAATKRRSQLVLGLVARGFFPNYESDIVEIEPDAVLLQRQKATSVEALVPAVETGFARLNAQLHGLQRRLRTRISELEAADRHIARLEEKVLQLKKTKRDLKQLKAEKQVLRKSPERKIGQVFTAPYRLPQKLWREVQKRRTPPPSARRQVASATEYQRWFDRHCATADDLVRMRAESRQSHARPLFSIIMPAFNTPLGWLEEAVCSVIAQAYENWELLVVDDGSTDPALRHALESFPTRDQRLRPFRLENNSGISAASNHALAHARGDWIGLLDHDDALEPDALFHFAQLAANHPDADLIYSDEDKITDEGLDAPLFKPDWSPDFFLSLNYLGHLTCVRRALAQEIGGFRSEFDGAQDYDFYFRIIERTTGIYHIPRALYHWRRTENSTADNVRRKPHVLDAGRRAAENYLRRRGQRGHVTVDWQTHAYWVKRELLDAKRISIVIATRDQIDFLARCITSISTKTSYLNYEIVVVDNESRSDEAREYFRHFEHRLLHFEGPFNFSALNNFAVERTDSPWLLFLNNDVEVIESEWLTTMAEHVQRPEVGAVGSRLLYPNDTVQHAGVVLGVGGIAEHAFRHFPADAPGVSRQLQVTRNYSAVTGACLLTRRDVFDEVGGFDEERLPVTYSDVDLCLKMRRAGYLVVYTPFAKLYHHESASRRRSVEALETDVMRERWPEYLERDPYYNPNLSRERADFSLGK